MIIPLVVVESPPTQRLFATERFVVEAPPFRDERPVTVRVPAVERLAGEKVPVVRVPETFRLVVVAFVVVELTAVKFWRVVEPVTKRVLRAVGPETERDVDVASVKIAFVARKMEAKREVEVEFVVVELIAVKF